MDSSRIPLTQVDPIHPQGPKPKRLISGHQTKTCYVSSPRQPGTIHLPCHHATSDVAFDMSLPRYLPHQRYRGLCRLSSYANTGRSTISLTLSWVFSWTESCQHVLRLATCQLRSNQPSPYGNLQWSYDKQSGVRLTATLSAPRQRWPV